MSDDTTTWLKKNPAVNPLRKSLKTSLRFHVPSSDMNSSIMSNPDKVRDQGLFIPRMLQRSNLQMRKSRASEFKVPEMITKTVTKISEKPIIKKSSNSGIKQKKIPTPNGSRKSLLPVSKGKSEILEKKSGQSILPRASFLSNGSSRRMTAKRELIKKAVVLSELKRLEEAGSQEKGGGGESSVLRSILKRRTSLRRSSQISAKKTKAKKVLFDRFDLSDEEKEKEREKENDDDNDIENDNGREKEGEKAEKEAGERLFPDGCGEGTALVKSSPEEWRKPSGEGRVDAVLELWQTYKDNLSHMQTERTSLEDSLESLLQHSLSVEQEYRAYRESAEEMYGKLALLGREIEEGLRRAVEGGRGQREGRIRMSEKSKAIKRNSSRKCVPVVRKELLRDMEDSFSLISRINF